MFSCTVRERKLLRKALSQYRAMGAGHWSAERYVIYPARPDQVSVEVPRDCAEYLNSFCRAAEQVYDAGKIYFKLSVVERAAHVGRGTAIVVLAVALGLIAPSLSVGGLNSHIFADRIERWPLPDPFPGFVLISDARLHKAPAVHLEHIRSIVDSHRPEWS